MLTTRGLSVAAAVLAALALSSATAGADDCRAKTNFKGINKAPMDAGAEKSKAAGKRGTVAPAAERYELSFEVEVSGCPEQGESRFVKASYGTVSFNYKKKYLGKGAFIADVAEKGTVNWSERNKQVSVTTKIDGNDAKGMFDVSDVQVERTVCGCR
jgi:hypothetical protein